MKILMLTYDLPFPLNSGGKIRDYHYLKNLSKKHEVTLFSFYRDESQREFLKELDGYCQRIILFKRPKVWSIRNIVLSLFSRLPFSATSYFFLQFKKQLLEDVKRNHYDLVYFTSFYPAVYLPEVAKLGVKTSLGNVNVEWQIYDRYARRLRFLPFRLPLYFDVWKMHRFEERIWQAADFNTAVSSLDAEVIKKATGRTCPVAFNGVDIASFSSGRRRVKRDKILFVGNLKYAANDEAMVFFLGEIFPLIKKQLVDAKFFLVSLTKPKWLQKYLSDPNITFIEDATTPAQFFLSEAAVSICPMRVASGTNIKVLEAMAAGVPVVATKIGAEGLEITPSENFLLGDTAEEFSAAIVRLLQNEALAKKIGAAGKKLVSEKYDWKMSFQVFEKEVLGRVSKVS